MAMNIFIGEKVVNILSIQLINEKSKIAFSYMLCLYSVKEPIGELNLKRALDEDTGVFSSFFHLLLHWVRQLFWEFHPSSVILGVFVFFFFLIFCESLYVRITLIITLYTHHATSPIFHSIAIHCSV